VPDRWSRTKGVAEKVKRLDWKVATPVRILTIDELRLCRMKNQPTGPEADLQGLPEPACFSFASTVADNVIRVSRERWLKAPVEMEDSSVVPRTAGTPQGGVVSPVLANLFLHYAFDRWDGAESLHPFRLGSPVRRDPARRAQANPPMKCRNAIDDVKTGGASSSPKGARDWLARVVRATPHLFAHWRFLYAKGRTSGAV
jgi:hypothetical protein